MTEEDDMTDPRFEELLGELSDAAPPRRPELRDQLHARYTELERGGTTSGGLPYPDPDDPLSEGANAIRALAEAMSLLADQQGVDLTAVRAAVAIIQNVLDAASPVAAEGRLLAGGPDGRISVGTPITGTNAVNANWVNQRLSELPSTAQANGPTSTAYSRNAVGSGFFTTWMNAQLQFMRNTSSRRYKEDIRTAEGLDAAVDTLRSGRVRWRQYHRIGQPDGTVELGLIAEECVDIPHLVAWDQTRDPETNDVVDEEWRPEAVRYETVLPVYLLEIVQRQNDELVELRARVDELAGR